TLLSHAHGDVQSRDLNVYFRIGAEKPRVTLQRRGSRGRCQRDLQGKRSTSTFDLRVVAGDRPLGNADVHVAGAACQRQDLLRDRQLQPQVAAVSEPELRAGREHEGELVVV